MHCRQDHPRLRGEYIIECVYDLDVTGSPPLARGIPQHPLFPVSVPGITPACAGNTRRYLNDIEALRDHPRLRGEYPVSSRLEYGFQGSPPLARGIH